MNEDDLPVWQGLIFGALVGFAFWALIVFLFSL
jgi:hypothetical protein